MKNGVITYIQNNTKRKRERKTINNRWLIFLSKDLNIDKWKYTLWYEWHFY
jgi:hypothetical protein